MIELVDINVTFNSNTALRKQVLNHFNLCILAHQFVTVIGSNGAGKTTLLNLLSGDVSPDDGVIKYNETKLNHLSLRKRAKLITRVYQDPLIGTCADLTIEENLALAFTRGKKRSWRLALPKSRLELFKQRLELLELGLENRLSEKVACLSGGERQALSLIMATITESKLLLLDEHTAALDPKMAAFIMRLTSKVVNEFDLTVLMITHSMKDALEYGDRMIMLSEGKIVLDLDKQQKQNVTVMDLTQQFHAL